MKKVVGLCHRLAYGTVLGLIVCYVYLIPIPSLGIRGSLWVVGVLNFPVSVFCAVTGVRAINSFASSAFAHSGTFQEVLVTHLRVAVPVCVVLFYVPNLIAWIVRRLRPQKGDESHREPRAIGHI